MSDAVDVAIAKAVTAKLIEAQAAERITVPGGVDFLPRRSYAEWEKPFDSPDACELGKLYIDVVAEEQDQSAKAGTKSKLKYEVPISIAVRRKFGQESLDDEGCVQIEHIDALKLMVQQIFEEFSLVRMDDPPFSVWEDTEILINPSHEHLQLWQQFTGIVLLSFVASKVPGAA